MAECFRSGSESLKYLFLTYLLTIYNAEGLSYNVVTEAQSSRQSSTSQELESDLAHDGNGSTCSKTALEKGFWKIDLGQPYTVSSVQVNQDGAALPVDLLITDDEWKFADATYRSRQEACRFGVNSEDRLECYSPMRGRYVILFAQSAARLSLCEIKLYECEGGYFGKDCESKCQCKDGVRCDIVTGRCPGGCKPGYTGLDCQDECPENTFGQNCSSQCHCLYDVCDKQNGACQAGCLTEWLGEDCQTRVPWVDAKPLKNRSTETSIKVMWPSWGDPVAADLQLLYFVYYRERNHEKWINAGDPRRDTPAPYETYEVTSLNVNTNYAFKVVPVIEEGQGGGRHEGTSSPVASYFKTRCAEPEPPTDLEVFPGVDYSRGEPSAMAMVVWKPPDENQVNCDSIKYYNIIYFRQNGGSETLTKAWRRDESKNITGLDFDATYEVQVIVENNEDLRSRYNPRRVFSTVSADTVPQQYKKADTYLIVGVVVCVGLVVGVGLVAALVYRRRKAKYSMVPNKEDGEEGSKLNNLVKAEIDPSRTDDSGLGGEGSSESTPVAELLPENHVSSYQTPPDLLIPDGPPSPLPRPDRHPIRVDELEDYVIKGKENESELLRAEYKEIPDGFQAVHEQGVREGNKHKNRFINIIAYDHSRVILEKEEGDPDSDYVNANYIDGYKEPKKYIASQGCTKYTIQDMWRMVWQCSSTRIIMATNLIENGKRKCELYWPEKDNEEKLYGDLAVTVLDIEQTSDFVIRTFNLRKGEENRNIKQFHFTAWPDHGVPTRASPIIHFRRKVRSFDETHPGVIVVHCSAGVGRTGTFIALDYLLDMAKVEGLVDVYGLTMRMRKDMVNMIQTVEQYIFVYDALLEALKAGNTAIPCSEFKVQYEKLLQVDPEKNKSGLELQFALMAPPQPKSDDCLSGQLPENALKNRDATLLPADKYRPYLMTRVQGTNDYINAVFLDGYKHKNAYILTQMPLPHTVIDLWRMIYEHNCGSVVMLNPWDMTDGSYGQYWPEDNEECVCGPFVIEATSIDRDTNPNVIVRELKLQYQTETPPGSEEREKRVRRVNQFQLTSWGRDSATPDLKAALIVLIDLVERSQLKTGNGPIVIHCHDGVRQSGLYAAVSAIWERMKIEQELDIFHSVKQLRFHRPQVISDLEQYQFCFEMVLAYLAEYQIYANFR